MALDAIAALANNRGSFARFVLLGLDREFPVASSRRSEWPNLSHWASTIARLELERTGVLRACLESRKPQLRQVAINLLLYISPRHGLGLAEAPPLTEEEVQLYSLVFNHENLMDQEWRNVTFGLGSRVSTSPAARKMLEDLAANADAPWAQGAAYYLKGER